MMMVMMNSKLFGVSTSSCSVEVLLPCLLLGLLPPDIVFDALPYGDKLQSIYVTA